MIFEYAGYRFSGSRLHFIERLKVYLNKCTLTWDEGTWGLYGYTTTQDCTASEAKRLLTEQIINSVTNTITLMIKCK